MYKLGTNEDYLTENPKPQSEDDQSQSKRWVNPKKDECLWVSEQGTITENEKFNITSVWLNSISGHTNTKYYINKNGQYTAGIVEDWKR